MATVYEGAILTVDENDSRVRFLVEERGKVVHVGDDLPRRFERATRVDLAGRCIVPAFADTHMSLSGSALFLESPDVSGCANSDEVAQAVNEAAGKGGSGPVLAFGCTAPAVDGGKRFPTCAQLDGACPGRPCLVVEHGCRAGVVNSAMAKHAAAALKDAEGFDAESGRVSRQAFFAVVSAASSLVDAPRLASSMQHAIDEAAAHGIGLVHAVSGLGFAGGSDVTLEKHVAKSVQHGFQVKVCHRTMDKMAAMRKRMLRVGACMADALDGNFEDREAALIEPYATCTESHGAVFHGLEQVDAFCRECNKANMNVRLTAMGDAAVHQGLHGLDAALAYWPRSGHRLAIAGACLMTPEDMAVCAKAGYLVLAPCAMLNDAQLPADYLRETLGEGRFQRFMPLRSLWEAGVRVSAASFSPCSAPDPLRWMAAVCNHPVPGQSLTVTQALRMCTANGAYAGFDEGVRGTLEKGKAADFAILSADPLKAGPAKVGEVQVEGLVLSGKPYERQTRSYASIVASGLFGNGRF